MHERRASNGTAFRRRLSWALFCGASTLALVACVLTAHATGGRTNAGLVLVGGLIAIGIAALLMSAIVSPLPDHGGSGQVPSGSRGMGGSGLDGGGYGGGDYGGGADSCN